jgi:hypothetical protein
MQLDCGKVGSPHHRGRLLDQTEIYTATPINRARSDVDPIRPMTRAALLKEPFGIGSIGIAAKRDAPTSKMRNDDR